MPRRSGNALLQRQIGARIRSLREEKGLTQERLAWECDLAKAYMSQVESGKRLPSVPVLAALAKRLGVDLVDIVALDMRRPRHRLLDAARRRDKVAVREELKRMRLK